MTEEGEYVNYTKNVFRKENMYILKKKRKDLLK